MKTIEVVAAVIHRGNRVFATQRGYGPYKDGWEFPGGKIEKGESPEAALKSEIQEELDTCVEVEEHLCTVEYDYPEFHLHMDCYLATIVDGHLELKEHEAAKWLDSKEIDSVGWLPADLIVVEKLKSSALWNNEW